VLVSYEPTAVQLVALPHDTDISPARFAPTGGAGTDSTDHIAPFQRSMRGIDRACEPPEAGEVLPTAKQVVACAHATPANPEENPSPRSGVAFFDQWAPSHVSTSGDAVTPSCAPTAMHEVALKQVIDERPASRAVTAGAAGTSAHRAAARVTVAPAPASGAAPNASTETTHDEANSRSRMSAYLSLRLPLLMCHRCNYIGGGTTRAVRRS
jgi:hypothetical protein